jgi:hypothetical protein
MNNFFEITPENHDEVFDKWQRLTKEEKFAVSTSKSRIYVSVDDITFIQDMFEMVATAAGTETRIGKLHKNDERRLMQMGYALEEVKRKLIKKGKS